MRAIFEVGLSEVFRIDSQIELDAMIDSPAEDAVVVRIEEAQVAVDTLTGTAERRTFTNPGIRVMAGGATTA